MKCSKCGAKALSELCFKCKPKKPLSSGKSLTRKMLVKSYIKPKNQNNVVYTQQINHHDHSGKIMMGEKAIKIFKEAIQSDLLKNFFLLCWKNKPHYSEVSGKFLGNKCSSLYQHHILPKSKYPEVCFDEENIVFLTPDEHASVELDMYKYEYINKKRELLKIKYNIL